MTADTIAKELRDGLEGVTPGDWRDYIDPMSDVIYVADDAGNTLALMSPMEDDPRAESANARHIARCSRKNIAALLDHIEALEKALEAARPYLIGYRLDQPAAAVLAQIDAVLSGDRP